MVDRTAALFANLLEILGEVRARGCLVVAAGALLLALVFAGGATARTNVHRRHGGEHVEVHKATTEGSVSLGKHDGYEVAVSFRAPHEAVLYVGKADKKSQTVSQTTYGAHFQGSLLGGRVTARFGPIGSLSLRFRPGSMKPQVGRLEKHCTGTKPRSEPGSFVGHVELHGEGGYFDVAADGGSGELQRTFVERCQVSGHKKTPRPVESLREATEPPLGLIVLLSFSSSLSTLWAVSGEEGGRQVVFRAAHLEGSAAGAETIASAFEYEGKMPIGRLVWVPSSPAGSLVTSLPGEHPATATVKSVAPFSGEAEYLGVSSDSHEWTGDLAVQFLGLRQPLTGPDFGTSLCVASTLILPLGCDYAEPNFKGSEAEAAADSLPVGVAPGSPGWGPLLEKPR
jgi:hypothetical protein